MRSSKGNHFFFFLSREKGAQKQNDFRDGFFFFYKVFLKTKLIPFVLFFF